MFFNILVGFFVIINILSFLFCVYDKFAAKKNLWRISEAALLWLCALGGSVVMFFTMKMIRHKTLHKKFMVGIPVIIVLQIILTILLYSCIDKVL